MTLEERIRRHLADDPSWVETQYFIRRMSVRYDKPETEVKKELKRLASEDIGHINAPLSDWI